MINTQLNSLKFLESMNPHSRTENSSISETSSKRLLSLEESLSLLYDKVTSQYANNKTKNESQSTRPKFSLLNNSILVSCDKDKIILDKSNYYRYETEIESNILNLIASEDFSLFFAFSDSQINQSGTEASSQETAESNSNTVHQSNPYYYDFSDQIDEKNLFFSKEKEKMYLNNYPRPKLNFGDSPFQIYDKIGKSTKKQNVEKEVTKFLNTLYFLPCFVEKNPSVEVEQDNQNSNKTISESKEEEKKVAVSQNEEEFLQKKRESKTFNCELCSAIFATPQGLGGHMSSTHKEQSVKFQKKKEIRDSRTPARKLLEEAKRILCAKFNIDYDELINTKMGKIKIKEIILQNEKEYKLIRRELKEKKSSLI